MQHDQYQRKVTVYLNEGFSYYQLSLAKYIAQSSFLNYDGHMKKLLQAIIKTCRIMLLNQLQLIFFGYILTKRQWPKQQVSAIMNIHQLKIDMGIDKQISLYILLTSFLIKFYLNGQLIWLQQQMNNYISNFKIAFNKWAKGYGKKQMQMNPKAINQFYSSTIPRMMGSPNLSTNICQLIDQIEGLQKWDD